jgi:hypothetical protein
MTYQGALMSECYFKVGDRVQVFGEGRVFEILDVPWQENHWMIDIRDGANGDVFYDCFITNLRRAGA